MINFFNFFRHRKRAFLYALIYVGLGTLSVCSIYPKDFFYGEWSLYGLIITFPVVIISFGYRFAEAQYYTAVFIIQLIMLIITFLFLSTRIKDH